MSGYRLVLWSLLAVSNLLGQPNLVDASASGAYSSASKTSNVGGSVFGVSSSSLSLPFSPSVLQVRGGSSSSQTVETKNTIPQWVEIHNDREKMAHYMELARQRHLELIQKAKDAYFHGGPSSSSSSPNSFSTQSLIMDQYHIQANGCMPDFVQELDRVVFVTNPSTPLFTKEECQDMITKAEQYFQETNYGEWTTLPSGQYNVAGFWIKSIPQCHEWFNRMVQERLFPLLVQQFPQFCNSMEDLVVDNAYLFKYTPETGRRTDVHTDSGCLSFTIALNSNQDYLGGGTWFEGLNTNNNNNNNNVIEMDIGQCTVRPGGVKHCGHAVTSGTRYIIGGFCMNVNKVEYVRMLMGLGSEQNQKQNYQMAREALEVAIALNPNHDGPYSHLADVYKQLGETDKAQQVLEHCFYHINPQCAEVAYSLGAMYMNQGLYDKAKICMKPCLEADDCDVDAMMVMAQACAGQNDHAGEAEWYQRIVTTPGASDDVAAKAYCNLGVLHEGTDQEMEFYEKSLQLKPDSFPPCFSLACAYATKKNWDLAIQAFRNAINMSQDKSEDQYQALEYLYKVTMKKLQSENPEGPSSREEMMKRFVDIMGEDNYHRLAAMKR